MSLFCCPNCGDLLIGQGNTLHCSKGHSFDLARSGYVNLLLSQESHQKHHGDDKAMVAARSAFLDGGCYAPMREAMIRLAGKVARAGMTILDAGCGEGYYTAELAERLQQQGMEPKVAAIDISKAALMQAHRRSSLIELAVASCFHLPVAGESIDLLLSVFAPYCGEEFLRVLRPGGHLLMVIPLERHLMGLKQAIYENPYLNEVKDYSLPGFRLKDKEELRYPLHLHSQEEIQSLFMMTPYYYKTGAEDQQKVAALTELKTPAEFAVLLYQKE